VILLLLLIAGTSVVVYLAEYQNTFPKVKEIVEGVITKFSQENNQK
jgi:hypothetical protein